MSPSNDPPWSGSTGGDVDDPLPGLSVELLLERVAVVVVFDMDPAARRPFLAD